MKAVRRPPLPDPPFTHHDWLGYSGKEHLGTDHMGTEMLVLDRRPILVDSGFRWTSIRWYSISYAFQPSFSSSRTR